MLGAGAAGVLAGCGEPEVVIKEVPVDRVATQVVEKIVTVTAPPGPLTGTILADGSSTVGPVTQAVAEEFRGQFPEVRVPVGVSGSGAGFKKFCIGETDISNASRPIKAKEIDTCAANGIEFVEVPVAFDGLAVLANPANDFADCLTVAELQKIWEPAAEDTITSWAQVRDGFPDEPLILYGPGVDSGTYDYFTDAIVGEEGASRGDFTPSEDDNVLVQGIAGDASATGFFGLAYYAANQDKLKLVSVDGGDGLCGADGGDGEHGDLPAALAAVVHLHLGAGGGAAGSADVRRVLLEERGDAGGRRGLRGAAAEHLRPGAGALQQPRDGLDLRGRRRQGRRLARRPAQLTQSP